MHCQKKRPDCSAGGSNNIAYHILRYEMPGPHRMLPAAIATMISAIYRPRCMSNCDECDAEIPVPTDALEGEIVTCPECGASFELAAGADGFDLRPAQTVGEDWGQ